jgi:hypothetical protein
MTAMMAHRMGMPPFSSNIEPIEHVESYGYEYGTHKAKLHS